MAAWYEALMNSWGQIATWWSLTSASARPGAKRDANCSFCGQHYRDAGPLVEGPGNAFVCGSCAERALNSLHEAHGTPSQKRRCSFCRHSTKQTGNLFDGLDCVSICIECTELVRSILDQERRRRVNLEPTSGE